VLCNLPTATSHEAVGQIISPRKILITCTNLETKRSLYDRGFSFFSLNNARSDTPDTFTTLNRTPGISPTA
jgi:hypothetical protein